MAIYKSCQRINSKILGDMKVPPTFINQQPPKARDVIGHELVKALTKTPNFRIDEVSALSRTGPLFACYM